MRRISITLLLLFGCTGGRQYAGVDATETGEGVPPVVLSTTPADGAADLTTAVQISIEFSEPIDPDSVTTESLRVLGPDGVAFPATATVDGNDVTLVLGARLNPDAAYQVEIADTVRDVEGDALAEPYSFGFSTSGGWETPMRFATTDAPVHLAADSADGNAVVLWVVGACAGGCAGNYTLYASTYSSESGDGAFDAALTVAALSSNPITSIAVTIDDSGAATAVWTQTSGTYRSVRASRLTPGIGWSTPGLIETEDLGHASSVKADVTADGTVYVVWDQRNGTTPNLWANRYVPGTGWAGAALLETAAEDATLPAVVALPDGGAMAVWSQAGNVGFSRFSGSTWTGSYIPSIGSDFRIAAIADDDILLTWLDAPVAVSLYNGVGWTTPQNLDGGTAEELVYELDVVAAGDGGIVVWTEGSLLPQRSVYQARYDGSDWGTTGEIESLSGGSAAPRAASSRDRAMVVWEQATPGGYVAYGVEQQTPDEWRTPEVISDPTVDVASPPQVLYDSRTNAFLSFWVQGDGLYWNRYR